MSGVRRILLLCVFSIVTVDGRIEPREGCQIKHVHLAVGHDPSTCMTVSFASTDSDKGPPPVGFVELGQSPLAMDRRYYEKTTSPVFYNVTDASPRNPFMYHSPYFHHIEICGLEPDTRYYYRAMTRPKGQHLRVKETDPVGAFYDEDGDLQYPHRQLNEPPYTAPDRSCPSMRKFHNFRTAPKVGTLPINLALMGDLGQYSHSRFALSRMMRDKEKIHALILAGDISYANGFQRAWDTFFDFMDDYDIAAHVPLQVCPGNHDIDRSMDVNHTLEIFTAYEHRFHMPRVRPAVRGLYDGEINWDHYHYPLPYDYGNSFYSWTYGGVHNIMLNAYTRMEPDSPQYQWLVDDFAKINRETTPWVIVTVHVPIYNTYKEHQRDPQVLAVREHLEPLFVENHVNLVVSGHVHAFQRSHPVALGNLNETGPVHVTVGSSGRQCRAAFRAGDKPEWLAVASATTYGYGMLKVHNATHATWNWIHTGHTEQEQDEPLPPASDRLVLENQYALHRRQLEANR